MSNGEEDDSAAHASNTPNALHVFSGVGVLIPNGKEVSEPNRDSRNVRRAMFASTVSCKFAINGAHVITGILSGDPASHYLDGAGNDISAKPM